MDPSGRGGAAGGTVVVLGNFDGVHRGHREVARSAAEIAAARGLRARIVTFVPHPSAVLGRGAPEVLTSLARKRELVAALTPPIELYEQPFDLGYAAQSPRDFAEHLRATHDAAVVVVGDNFRFGKGRAGDFATLASLGAELGFEARAESLVVDDEGAVSSTRIRRAIGEGAVETATRLLGRPHMVEGRVEHGKKLGRTIGFPTCNLGEAVELVPALGIYATLVDLVGEDGRARALARGATSVGTNPTVATAGARTIETYLFDGCVTDYERELYGERIRVHFAARLRGEERFDGLEALTAQMKRDVARSLEITEAAFPQATRDPAWA
jgi:riboflavin kinase/FMN adenylyltransferase